MLTWLPFRPSPYPEETNNWLPRSTTRQIGQRLLNEPKLALRRRELIERELSQRIELMRQIPHCDTDAIFQCKPKGFFESFTAEYQEILRRGVTSCDVNERRSRPGSIFLDYDRHMLEGEVAEAAARDRALREVEERREAEARLEEEWERERELRDRERREMERRDRERELRERELRERELRDRERREEERRERERERHDRERREGERRERERELRDRERQEMERRERERERELRHRERQEMERRDREREREEAYHTQEIRAHSERERNTRRQEHEAYARNMRAREEEDAYARDLRAQERRENEARRDREFRGSRPSAPGAGHRDFEAAGSTQRGYRHNTYTDEFDEYESRNRASAPRGLARGQQYGRNNMAQGNFGTQNSDLPRTVSDSNRAPHHSRPNPTSMRPDPRAQRDARFSPPSTTQGYIERRNSPRPQRSTNPHHHSQPNTASTQPYPTPPTRLRHPATHMNQTSHPATPATHSTQPAYTAEPTWQRHWPAPPPPRDRDDRAPRVPVGNAEY
ncbi:hypothetical protein IMSHALPRED_010560 [Imshaugia aleurites]|uniref:Uncharacterized protein n=1 Tax=Imshaugia aleurites TaxID=172621 RepID=A0A8H3EZP1_9LECA|nr:hypothetical protein IMSHALPRED_010560 [Imshaugia aleurites]